MPEPLFPGLPDMPFTELQSVDSTNNYALAQIHAGLAQHGAAFFAHEQVRGKGQRGKSWQAERGTNITMSIVINPYPLLVSQQFRLSACIAISAFQLFRKYAGDDTTIKWPNDIYWQDRKAGGILIENVLGKKDSSAPGMGEAAGWKWAIAGAGININQARFPAELKNPVSLKQITGKDHDPILLARELQQLVSGYFADMAAQGFEAVYGLYLRHLYKKEQAVKLKKNNRVFEATVKKVTETGKLVVQHAVEEEFGFGEIEWII